MSFIDTARGGIVDNDALNQAFINDQITSTGGGVFTLEPPAPDRSRLQVDNVVAAPQRCNGLQSGASS